MPVQSLALGKGGGKKKHKEKNARKGAFASLDTKPTVWHPIDIRTPA